MQYQLITRIVGLANRCIRVPAEVHGDFLTFSHNLQDAANRHVYLGIFPEMKLNPNISLYINK